MCGGFPSSTTQGPQPPRMTLWEAIVILWREAVFEELRQPESTGKEPGSADRRK